MDCNENKNFLKRYLHMDCTIQTRTLLWSRSVYLYFVSNFLDVVLCPLKEVYFRPCRPQIGVRVHLREVSACGRSPLVEVRLYAGGQCGVIISSLQNKFGTKSRCVTYSYLSVEPFVVFRVVDKFFIDLKVWQQLAHGRLRINRYFVQQSLGSLLTYSPPLVYQTLKIFEVILQHEWIMTTYLWHFQWICRFRKYSYSSQRGDWNFLGVGGSLRPKI